MIIFMIVAFLSSSWAAIGAPLANHLWQSTLFAGVAGLLTLMLRKNHAQARYWLWLTASAKFLIPFSLLVGMGSHLGWLRAPAVTQGGFFLVMQQISQPFGSTKGHAPPPAASTAVAVAARLLPTLLLLVWFCGCAAVLFLWWLRWRRMTAAIRGALPVKSGREAEALRRLERSGGVAGQIELIVSECALEPGIMGIFRPAMLLPAGIADRLTDAQLEAIITHELCHVRRRDNLAAAVHMLVEAIFWFHPLVWWIGAELVDERERACDEEVLRLGSDPQAYAETILKVCEFYLESPLVCAAGVLGSNLKKRMETIMTHRTARKLDLGRKLLLAAMGAAAVLGPVAIGLVDSASSRGQSQPEPIALPALEAVSIKPTKSSPAGIAEIMSKKEDGALVLTLTNSPLVSLIGYAYDLDKSQIAGVPEWVTSESYDISAKMSAEASARMPNSPSAAPVRLAFQKLLADRFKLRFHREMQEHPVYELIVAENGPTLNELQMDNVAPRDIATTVKIDPPGHLVATQITMPRLVGLLQHLIGGLVSDKTGLKGVYDFKLDWTATSGDPTASILTAVPEQLGLELKPQAGPVSVLIIDHAEEVTGDE